MNENISTISSENAVSGAGSEAFKVIVVGGLTVGILDCAAASFNGIFKGISPAIVWQYVASGLLGRDSYRDGWQSVILGLLIHFFIAFSVTIIYYAASRRLPILVRRAVLSGTLYGIAVYLVMAYAVTPLSAAGKIPISVESMLIGSLIHIFCVGLPIAFITRQFAENNRENSFIVNKRSV